MTSSRPFRFQGGSLVQAKALKVNNDFLQFIAYLSSALKKQRMLANQAVKSIRISCKFIKILIKFIYLFAMWTNNRQSKVTVATIDGYSKSNKYTQTFFHHPTRNPHCELQYERKNAQQPAKTFRLKGKTEFKQYMYESSLNPFRHNQSHHQKEANITGDRKKTVNFHSNKATDPVNLSFEPFSRPTKPTSPYTPSHLYKMEVQRRDYLPAERELSKSRKLYHSQIGFSLSARDLVRPRPIINNSSSMKTTIQYEKSKEMNQFSCFDDFKYNSRK